MQVACASFNSTARRGSRFDDPRVANGRGVLLQDESNLSTAWVIQLGAYCTGTEAGENTTREQSVRGANRVDCMDAIQAWFMASMRATRPMTFWNPPRNRSAEVQQMESGASGIFVTQKRMHHSLGPVGC